MKKRLFSILLIPCIALILMPIMAFAETRPCSRCGGEFTVEYTYYNPSEHYANGSCGKCGWSATMAGKHKWDDGVIETPSTCKKAGTKKYTCTECGGTKTEEIAAKHDWGWSTDESRHWQECKNCKEKGYCGDHIWNDYVTETSATCTKTGWEYHECKICERQSGRPIPAGHNLVHHEAQTATCTANGWNAYDTCNKCDYTTYREIPPAGHNFVHHKAQTATCTANGWDAYDTCNKCDYTTYREILATGHSFSKWETVIYPSCTYNGSEKRTCTVCQAVETKDISSNGHSWESDYTIDKEATCESDGSKSIHCRYCDAVKDSETITATGHKEVVLEAKSATVFSNGLTEGKKCSVCGAVLVAQEEIPELEVGTPAFTVNAAKKTMTVKASRAENATGYKILYKKANAKEWKTWTVKGKKISKKFAKLEKGKYKVKVRAYAKDYEGSGAVKWGKISYVKTVKIK